MDVDNAIGGEEEKEEIEDLKVEWTTASAAGIQRVKEMHDTEVRVENMKENVASWPADDKRRKIYGVTDEANLLDYDEDITNRRRILDIGHEMIESELLMKKELFQPGTGVVETVRTIAGKEYRSADFSGATDLLPDGKSEWVAGDAVGPDGKQIPIPLCKGDSKSITDYAKLNETVKQLDKIAATTKGRTELRKWGYVLNELLCGKCWLYKLFFTMVGKEQRTQASGHATWNDYLTRPDVRKHLRFLMGRHNIDSEHLGDAIWGDVAFSVSHILRCVFVLAIGERAISNPDMILFMAKCAFGQIRMNYWGAADNDCDVRIATIRKANKTLSARNRLDDLETVSFFARARASGVTCASGYFEIIGVGDLQFDRIKFQNFRFVETNKKGDSAAVDCHRNGDVKVIMAGTVSSFDEFTMLRELRLIVNEYFPDMPDRQFTGSDTARTSPDGPLYKWWRYLGGETRDASVIGEAVRLLPGSLGWRIVFHKMRGPRYYYHFGAGKTTQKL